ncbi:capsular polysaccharide biosynthesis protein [Cognatishimia maritima]|uniref:Capsular polysaccharide export protein n=1 Tax=Cognatishimia maritima TaxID=870908 RepID=A0A1M5VAP4_9RHOB|nr:capsular polysaccharide biosynthesis protein [Cognatishimia maritima]SHH72174.1 capsular polysaccharide export protein [Cognatishimia maritima]
MHPATDDITIAAGTDGSRRLFVYNGGFLTQKRVRRILALSGYQVSLGLPGPDDLIGIWGKSPTAHRGEKIAEQRNVDILRVEDAPLRSLFPGKMGEPPVGLFLDRKGVHFDPSQPSDLETLLATHPLDDTALLDRARECIARIQDAHLTKYAAVPLDTSLPEPGYVLVIDQTRGDAAVAASKAGDAHFQEMLVMAQEENPGAPILIKTHPETQQGLRSGYFSEKDCNERISLWDSPVSPWKLFEGAVGVYTLSSQMGFEAIFAGHKPRVFGQPFYAGWGLTNDERPPPRRHRHLTRAQLFAGAMLLYAKWYDPYRDQLCPLETVIGQLEAQARAWREDHQGWNGHGIRLWKRKHFQRFFGQHKRMTFQKLESDEVRSMTWGTQDGPTGSARVEDGFLRSRGLGAELVPPLSLIVDHSGIYYDPARPSDLENLIAARADMRPDQRLRAVKLIEKLNALGVSKYNLGGTQPKLPQGRLIFVPGQVEDDASILRGTDEISTNRALLLATRAAHPEATIVYKPHPDVAAGLREGHVADADLIADQVLEDVDMGWLLQQVDEVSTMTSLAGFEALIRGCQVTTYGAPFYAGWGLTQDMGKTPLRRQARVELPGLVHAVLIDAPRYLDPVTRLPCPVEVAVERLAAGDIPHPGLVNRLLSKTQGVFASRSGLWR